MSLNFQVILIALYFHVSSHDYRYENNTKLSKRAFYKFNQLVCSEGTFIESNYLIEATSSTYAGMSGSPIVSNNKLIDTFFGEPPMPDQRVILSKRCFLLKDSPIEVYKGLKCCITYDICYTKPILKIF